jgi:hypothetical protein
MTVSTMGVVCGGHSTRGGLYDRLNDGCGLWGDTAREAGRITVSTMGCDCLLTVLAPASTPVTHLRCVFV